MKKTVLTLVGCMAALIMLASNGQFEKAMGENIPAMFQARDAQSLQSVINKLNRIGEAEKGKWEPHYYVAFGYIRMMAFAESAEDKDKYLDQALVAIEKGESVKPNDSELESLRGYVHMMRVTIDPPSRGMQYSGMAFTSFNKAIAIDPNNARAHFLLGRMQYGTAQFMGNGDGGACESFQKAKEILESKGQNSNPFAPTWGMGQTKEAIEQMCNG